jgi:hypothetical protein
MNKYLEKIAEQSYKQDAKEIATAGAAASAVGAYVGKKDHEKMVSNVGKGVAKPRGLADLASGGHAAREAERAVAGRKIAPMLDKAFKARNIASTAGKFGALGLGVSTVGHAWARSHSKKD